MKNPIQPLVKDAKGVLRFKENAIVRHLLDYGNINLNRLAELDFSDDDRQQFAQLIGYSLIGYGELSYVSNDAYGTAAAMADEELTEDKARALHLEAELSELRSALRPACARLFGVHEDDLKG